ncbi:MAG: putative sugar O-methyltransferase [Hyphomicrobiaceae bacterium]
MVESNVTTLDQYAIYQKIMAAIDTSLTTHASNEFSGTSKMWREIFSRRNSDSGFDSIFRLLDQNNDVTLGVANLGDPKFQTDYVRLYETIHTQKDICRITPSDTGCPSLIQVHGRPANLAIMQNETRIKQLFDYDEFPKRPIRVLEIGAGYGGMANLLIKRGAVISYTIVDLPDNLALSAYYLTMENPDFTAHYCAQEEFTNDGNLNFFTPGEISKIGIDTYDLVINCDSLGEMPADVCRNYVDRIYHALLPGGLFYSKNGVQRNEGTVENLSQFKFDQFELLSVQPSPLSTGLFDDHSTVLLLKKNVAKHTVDWNQLDILSWLLKFGLGPELDRLCKDLGAGTLGADQILFLKQMKSLFDNSQTSLIENKFEYDDKDLVAAAMYMVGMHQFVFHDHEEATSALEKYIEIGKSPVAVGQALIFLSGNRHDVLKTNNFKHELTRFFIRTNRLPISTEKEAKDRFFNAAVKRVRNRFLGLLPGQKTVIKEPILITAFRRIRTRFLG